MLDVGVIPCARARRNHIRFSEGVGGSLREPQRMYMENNAFSCRNVFCVSCLFVVGVIQEHFNVTICRCPISGVISDEEWRDHNGLLHRMDEPAIVRRNRDSGTVFERGFYWHDQLHRTGGEPAQLDYAEGSGRLLRRLWCAHGEFSRPGDLPHVEFLDEETGIIVRAEYRIRTKTAQKGSSQLHRDNGPALLLFDRITGEQTEAAFYRRGRKQGISPGPAVGL